MFIEAKCVARSLGKHINLEIYFRSLDKDGGSTELEACATCFYIQANASSCIFQMSAGHKCSKNLRTFFTTVSIFTPFTRHNLFPPPRIKHLPHPCNHHLSTLAFSIIFLALKIIHTPFHGLSYLLGLLFSRSSLSLLLF